MKKVTLAVALTGSCALFYLLYNMKQKSRERSSKNKIKASQFEKNKNKCSNEENSIIALHSKENSEIHCDKLTNATEYNSELPVLHSICESSTIMNQNNNHSKETINGREEMPRDIQFGSNINEMCSANQGKINVYSSFKAKNLPSQGSESYSNFSLPSEAGFHDFFVENINELISESNSSAMPDTVENSSRNCPNIFKTEIDVNNELNSLSISNANPSCIPVGTVPEKNIDSCQISLQQECLSNINSENLSLNETTPKLDLIKDNLVELEGEVFSFSNERASVAPVLYEDDSTRSSHKDNSLLVMTQDCKLSAAKNKSSSLTSEQTTKEYCEPVTLVTKTDSLIPKEECPVDNLLSKSTVTKAEMEPPQKSKKKKLKGKKRAAKDPVIDKCKETEPVNSVNKVSDFNSSKYLCDPNIKKGFWSASEVEGNLKNKSIQIEDKVGSSSPDHLCTSDLEREASQTPEHENITSDSQSLASFDSGQGSIEQETIFSNMLIPEANSDYYVTYQFEIPQTLVGKLIGKKGAFLSKIKAATSTNVIVVAHNDDKYKLCSIEGKKWQVLQALDLIREHFPTQKFPELSLDQVNIPSPQHQPQINRQLLQVELPPGVVLEVQTSSIISTGEVWLQQPLHPTFSALQRLHQCLNLNYGDGSSTPTLPLTTPAGTVCVCQIGDQWLRCQVEEHDDEYTATVCLLDVGGYVSLPFTLLRQIRMDYASLPFQASRCYLYGIEPNTEEGWDEEGRSALLQLCNNTIIFATIAAYSEDGIPLVNLYQRHFNQYNFINEEIVKMNHAKWISTPTFTEST